MGTLIIMPTRQLTIAEAKQLSNQIGLRILWRPDGKVNYREPDTDRAEILSEG